MAASVSSPAEELVVESMPSNGCSPAGELVGFSPSEAIALPALGRSPARELVADSLISWGWSPPGESVMDSLPSSGLSPAEAIALPSSDCSPAGELPRDTVILTRLVGLAQKLLETEEDWPEFEAIWRKFDKAE